MNAHLPSGGSVDSAKGTRGVVGNGGGRVNDTGPVPSTIEGTSVQASRFGVRGVGVNPSAGSPVSPASSSSADEGLSVAAPVPPAVAATLPRLTRYLTRRWCHNHACQKMRSFDRGVCCVERAGLHR